MCLTELLDPKNGFIVNDICYIRVEIFRATRIIKSYQPEPVQHCRVTIQALAAKKEETGSVGTATQSAGNSKSPSNKNPGENQHTKTKHEKNKLSLPRWFQERKQNVGSYLNDNMGYQRLEEYD
ncbi:hypothetical protein MKW92_042139 [Papaver armeniacum]|nr:hypothetical protein MKW92_042139 [Papaver armeniacum]